MSIDWVKDISDMHAKFGFEGVHFNAQFLKFRQKFLEEEMIELDEAICANDPEGVVDALIDLCVVAIGTLDLGKVNSYTAWNEVFTANMEKLCKENPTRQGSGGFDLIKPENWKSPSHKGNTGYFDLAIKHIQFLIEPEPKNLLPSHIKTLQSYLDHAMSKTHDYDDEEDPEFHHAAYYPNGINDIMYEISKKVKRLRRILKRVYNGGEGPKTDSLHDSFRDISIYSGIGDTYVHGKLEGQSENRDMFNREKS